MAPKSKKMVRQLALLSICVLVMALTCSVAGAYTLTFDDVPSGTVLQYSSIYRDHYGASFASGFQAADHTGSAWGRPRSSPNVLIWAGGQYDPFARLLFGHYTPEDADSYWISSISAYFSTQMDTVVRLTAYGGNGAVASVLIGAAGESWENRQVVITCPQTPFMGLDFQAVASSAGLRGFCVDDMTITRVPEPSSVLALLTGLGSVAGVMLKRRQ